MSSGLTKRTGALTGPFLEGLRLFEPVQAGRLGLRFNFSNIFATSHLRALGKRLMIAVFDVLKSLHHPAEHVVSFSNCANSSLTDD